MLNLVKDFIDFRKARQEAREQEKRENEKYVMECIRNYVDSMSKEERHAVARYYREQDNLRYYNDSCGNLIIGI